MSEHNVLEVHLPYRIRFNLPIKSATLQLVGREPVGAREAGIKYILGYGDSRDQLYRSEPLSYEEAKSQGIKGKYLYLAMVGDDKTLNEMLIDVAREWPPGSTGSNITDRNATLSATLYDDGGN